MSEIKIERVTSESPLKSSVRRIFLQSFPLYERVSLDPFYEESVKGAHLYALLVDGETAAFFCTLNRGRFFYLFYIAVDEKKRGLGLGSKVLQAVIQKADGATVFLDCEGIYPGCKDRAKRVKRQCFYRRNGFREIGWLHTWRGEKFTTMVYGDAEISSEDIEDFWHVFGHLWESEDIAGDLDGEDEKSACSVVL